MHKVISVLTTAISTALLLAVLVFSAATVADTMGWRAITFDTRTIDSESR